MRKSAVYGMAIAVWLGCLLTIGVSCARYQYYTPPSQTTPVAPPRPTTTTSIPPKTSVRPPPPISQPAEVRAAWVSDTTRLDWKFAATNLQDAGFNTVYVNFASAGAAFYPGSRELPSLSTETTQQFSRHIKQAQQHGLQVHAKMIVLFMFKSPESHQKKMAAANRVMRLPNGQPVVQAGNMWLCPSHPANQKQLLDAAKEMVTLFPVDGIQYDYIRFSEEPSCYCTNCKEGFQRALGKPLTNWPAAVINGPHGAAFRQWRQNLINNWVSALTQTARQGNPRLIVSAAVFSDLPRAREEKSQDWQTWLRTGSVDYVCTMTYTTNQDDYEALIRKQLGWAPKPHQVVVGIGSWKMNEMNELQRQIRTARRLDTSGFALFSYDDMEAREFFPQLGKR